MLALVLGEVMGPQVVRALTGSSGHGSSKASADEEADLPRGRLPYMLDVDAAGLAG